MLEKKKYGPLPSATFLLIISVRNRKPKRKKLQYFEIFKLLS